MGSQKVTECPVGKVGSHWVTNNGDCISAVLTRNIACRLGLCMNNKPYVVPLSFTFEYDKTNQAHYIYLHWGEPPPPPGKSQKMKYIQSHIDDNRDVCIETDLPGPVLPEVQDVACSWDLSYASVIGYGKIEKVTEDEEKKRILCQKLTQCTGRSEWNFEQLQLKAVSVWKVTLKNKDTLARYRFLFPPDYANGTLTPVPDFK
ncbi:MAG: hypothetical protein GY869_04975 [Planctomycetes bacterium]|nr:hypothetical protein [Planctomycetota bacterium]